ncbi:flagellar hook-associated protein FlgL [Sporomusa termitida]|uniref:Flagellar hook-associated protein 3 n=1 Tax=Sporomusa termitida TaxID=2377 RepID=A0A517DQV9_9FIRM|nr:flagellar hook-associated protein FlgL [Sporomusa termitida]QDR79749.1 Flagellar hook-associated protein 3 [Sporomusa termitida]
MRITNIMMTDASVRSINKNMERLSKAQAQVSTQSKIQQPSDDPVVASRAIRYRSYVARVEQFQENVNNVTSWQKVTDSALSDLSDTIVQQLKELVVKAASTGTLNSSDLSAIKEEVTQLQQSAVDALNTTYGGRYVFGGYATDVAPYSLDSDNNVLFKGQLVSDFTDNGEEQAIKANIGYGSAVSINVEGQAVTGTGDSNLFATFAKVLAGLDSGDGEALTSCLDDIEANLDTILAAQADLGARMNYVSMVGDRLANDYTTYKEIMSSNEDVDIAAASAESATAQVVYEASLSVGVKVMSKSLLDYLA